MYKILHNELENEYLIIKDGTNFIPIDARNRFYKQFIQDVVEQGYDVVEGPNVVQPSYAELRAPEYPPIADQLDKIYHSGVNAWKAEIKEIKDKYPKAITGRTDIAPLPEWLYAAVDNYRFNQQLRAYVEASERLAQHQLSTTQERIVEEFTINGVIETVETQSFIQGLPSDDPRVIEDDAERAEAQIVVDNTPQNVKDSINN
jgi:hypothetical protein